MGLICGPPKLFDFKYLTFNANKERFHPLRHARLEKYSSTECLLSLFHLILLLLPQMNPFFLKNIALSPLSPTLNGAKKAYRNKWTTESSYEKEIECEGKICKSACNVEEGYVRW